MQTQSLLSEAVREEIDVWVKKFPPGKQQSALIPALRCAQKNHGGWLSTDVMDAVADHLSLPRIAVYEVASFYTLFHLEPVGKHRLYVCTNISCQLNHCDVVMDRLKNRLGIDVGETTPDGKFTLFEVECLGACAGAPAMQVGEVYHENLSPESIDALLKRLD